MYIILLFLATVVTLATWLRYFHNPPVSRLVLLGAVSSDSARIWVRCTGESGCQPPPLDVTSPREPSLGVVAPLPFPPVFMASVRFRSLVAGQVSSWLAVEKPLPADTGTAVILLEGLQADTMYEYAVGTPFPTS